MIPAAGLMCCKSAQPATESSNVGAWAGAVEGLIDSLRQWRQIAIKLTAASMLRVPGDMDTPKPQTFH